MEGTLVTSAQDYQGQKASFHVSTSKAAVLSIAMNQVQGFDLIGWCDAEGAVLWGSSLSSEFKAVLQL